MIITKIWFEDDRIYGLTDTGKTVWQSLLWYKRLRLATENERNDYEIDDEGIHWYNLDEDVSFESFEYDEREPEGVSKLFLSHPELNVSVVAQRLGINPALMNQYVNGIQKPSKECEFMIINEVRSIGQALASV